jgi:GT2 family glycosyltransferase
VDGPLISVVMPVFRPDLKYFHAAIDSLRGQTYSRWELCLCDDGSEDTVLTEHLRQLSRRDERIRVVAGGGNRGISAATNSAIRQSRGELIALMDQDDRLHPQALQAIACAAVKTPGDLYFTDEDRLDVLGRRVCPFFKPGWSHDLLQGMMYLGHLCVYRRGMLDRAGLCDSRYDGAQDWELALRCTDQPSCRVVHVPGIFYHWREGGRSAEPSFNRLCHERGERAVRESLGRRKRAARVETGPRPCSFYIREDIGSSAPLVSILIPTRDRPRYLRPCLESLRRRTDYEPLEILVLDNGSDSRAARRYLKRCPADRVLRYDMPFNHSRMNNLAARQAKGEFLLLLNDDTEALHGDWLTRMIECASGPDVGAVGGWLVFPDGRTQHNGVQLGGSEVARPICTAMTLDGIDRGAGRLVRDVSAVTGACLLIRRQLYLDIGGLDEDRLPTSFNDVDLCLRLREDGYKILQCPAAKLLHRESATRRIDDKEEDFMKVMRERWQVHLGADPFWNPLLGRSSDTRHGLAFRWRSIRQDGRAQDHVPALKADAAVPILENLAA